MTERHAGGPRAPDLRDDRNRAEEALRESESRLKRAQEIAHLGSWELDLARNELSWSDEVYRIFGLRPQEFGATYEAFLEAVHPDDRAAVDSAYSSSLREGRDVYEIEHRVVRRSTGEIRFVHEKCEHFRDASGRIVRSVGMVHDITERKHAYEALQRSRLGLSRLAEASLRVMSETKLEGMLQAISEAALELTEARTATCVHGWASGEPVARSATRAAGAAARPTGAMFIPGGIHMVLAEGAEAVRLTDRDLRAHPRWWGLPERHPPLRGLLGVRVVARDGRTSGMILVTDRQQGEFTAEDESLLRQLSTVGSLALMHVEARMSLEEADRRKSEFIAVLSHELRNPLAPICNSLHLLDHAPPGSQQAGRAMEVIHRQTGHLTRLVDDLLDMTRIAQGKIELQRERVDACEIVRRTCEDHRSLLEGRGISLRVEMSVPVFVEADSTRIAQILGNLLQNASRFSREGGTVTVGIGTAGGKAELRVRDDGIGISTDFLPRLFEPFVQADRCLARTNGGLGLGLTLVKGLAELHGGSVRAHSEGPDRGAEFVVSLPLATGGQCCESISTAPGASPSVRILVIEDNLDAAETIAEVLQMEGHRVEVANDGLSGLEKARALEPEVILCDIGLPDMDGYQIARALRADEALRSVRLVALSGYAQPEDRRRAREAGFDAHLPKPPSLEDLLAAVRTGNGDPVPGARTSRWRPPGS